jgi:hypothetical protein
MPAFVPPRSIAAALTLLGSTLLIGATRAERPSNAGVETAPVPIAAIVTSVFPVMAKTPDPIDEAAEEAVEVLSVHVKRASHPAALRTAFEAYHSYRAEHPDLVRKPYLYYVDLGLDNRTARGYVFDMERLTLVDGPFNVAHGTGSSRERNAVPTRFSNRAGSNASSLGLYLAQETYTFRGKAGGRAYTSVGLRMRGESGSFNGAARPRGVVAHGAPYVTAREAGRSQGCPAMEQHRAKRLLPMLADGGVVFVYSPRDEAWLAGDPWIRREGGKAGTT